MKIIQVVPAIGEQSSGPSYSVMRLCQSLIAEDQEVSLAVLDYTRTPAQFPFLKTFPLGWGPRRLGRSPAMYRWLGEQVRSNSVDLLHSHGMWQMNAIYPGWAAKKAAIPLVVSPRGAFSKWAMQHGSSMKKVFWPLLQRPALETAVCFHATADSEYEDIRRLGFLQPVAIIPNGIDIPKLPAQSCGEFRTLLFLGRIHKVKGLDILLHAWKDVQDRFPNWRLVIAGSDAGYYGKSGYLEELQTMVHALSLKRIEFLGELHGAEKIQAYRDADLFVLPTYSENFGMTVAESLSVGTPAIVSKGAPWGGVEENGCGWWLEIGSDPLIACLNDALALPRADLQAMGMRGRKWMEADFSWTRIGAQMSDTYRWLLDRSLPVPPWIRLG